MSAQRIIALLGRRDEPTDAVEEYCRYLGGALRPHGFSLEIARVLWAENGWPRALRQVREQSMHQYGQRTGAWVLLQYTALGWSRRGFPLGAWRALRALHAGIGHESRIGVVFHDATPYSGTRAIDRLRRRAQLWTMRRLFQDADRAIFTLPTVRIPWLPARQEKACFIPVGANLPRIASTNNPAARSDAQPVVAVFGVTGGENIPREAREIASAVNHAAARVGQIRLVVLGRNSLESRGELASRLDASRVELQTLGVLPAEEVAQVLSRADVLLFVRGALSTRRGSALAGIACGLPVVGYSGTDTATPLTEAGVVLAKEGDSADLAAALELVLSDASLRAALCARSRAAQEKYFSWKAIAAQYAEALRSAG